MLAQNLFRIFGELFWVIFFATVRQEPKKRRRKSLAGGTAAEFEVVSDHYKLFLLQLFFSN